MIENMFLTSYLDKSYLVASIGGQVASTQMMSRNKLKYEVNQQFMSREMTFMWHQRLRHTMTGKFTFYTFDFQSVHLLFLASISS